mmetsp:Transcript_33636/g.70553  ORF Transcript_33636/g.70553 Transcript_33636/m.70553 type:complete len:218 (-) Transcript_33636:606-1259(-)
MPISSTRSRCFSLLNSSMCHTVDPHCSLYFFTSSSLASTRLSLHNHRLQKARQVKSRDSPSKMSPNTASASNPFIVSTSCSRPPNAAPEMPPAGRERRCGRRRCIIALLALTTSRSRFLSASTTRESNASTPSCGSSNSMTHATSKRLATPSLPSKSLWIPPSIAGVSSWAVRLRNSTSDSSCTTARRGGDSAVWEPFGSLCLEQGCAGQVLACALC